MQRRLCTIRVDSETLERLQINAAANDRTLSAEVRRALRLYLHALDNQQVKQAERKTLANTP